MSINQTENKWLRVSDAPGLAQLQAHSLEPQVLADEQAVGEAMLAELEQTARAKSGDINIALLGGRGGQAFHRLLGTKARRGEIDDLLARLNVFTQDALAPLPMDSNLAFVRDFERLLGPAFFERIKSFVPMQTDIPDLFAALSDFAARFEQAGGLDIFFLGHGPEPNDCSHLAYIRPGSGAQVDSVAGLIPISSTILEHHITKFKAGGSTVEAADEAQVRAATHIMTLGPAAIIKAKKLVQSVVDASTAPAKKRSFRKVLDTPLATDPTELAAQLDANPGLWIRLHPAVKVYVLPDLLA